MPQSRPCNFELHYANGKDGRVHGHQNQEMAAPHKPLLVQRALTAPHGRRHVARPLPCDAAARCAESGWQRHCHEAKGCFEFALIREDHRLRDARC
jgi:hypothetical protein